MNRVRLVLLALAGLAAAVPALAQPEEWRKRDGPPRLERAAPPPHWRRPMDAEERRLLREDLVAPPQRGADGGADAQARRREAWRLREEVRSGRLSREEAMREYRERYGAHPGGRAARLTREEREQLRRDVLEASRDLERR
ncbi:MAG: hypothetical protein AB1773_07915 [Pseudomonadota bacterium]|jgi:hypothetical protein